MMDIREKIAEVENTIAENEAKVKELKSKNVELGRDIKKLKKLEEQLTEIFHQNVEPTSNEE